MSIAEVAPGARLSLELPPDVSHLLTARLFAGGVARSLELGEETSEVLRVMLTEICSHAIERRRGGRILIDVVVAGGSVRVTVIGTGVPREERSESMDATFRRTLIEALAPDATFAEDRDRLVATFTL